MKNKFSILYLLTIVALFALVGCGPQVQRPEEVGINMELKAMGDAQSVGETMLMVTMTDSSGAPINDATLNVQGDMSHAGMVPVIRDVDGNGEEGVYSIPFEWTMGGDWIVTVLAVLADGTEVEKTFDLSVASEGEGHEGHGDDGHAEGEGHGGHGDDGDKAMEMDAELVAAVEALDVKSIHDIDVGVNEDGAIDEDYVSTVEAFMMAFSMVSWPEAHGEDVESVNTVMMSLKEALEADDLAAAQPLATEAHDTAHSLIDAILEPGEAHDHGN